VSSGFLMIKLLAILLLIDMYGIGFFLSSTVVNSGNYEKVKQNFRMMKFLSLILGALMLSLFIAL
jgi:hypothetical protein